MCNTPSAPKPPAPPPAVVTDQDAEVTAARDRERRRQRTAGVRSTMLTGADGVTEGATTANKQLLGQ